MTDIGNTFTSADLAEYRRRGIKNLFAGRSPFGVMVGMQL
jgi:hypothetical protein